jgi:hypothetical protein
MRADKQNGVTCGEGALLSKRAATASVSENVRMAALAANQRRGNVRVGVSRGEKQAAEGNARHAVEHRWRRKTSSA